MKKIPDYKRARETALDVLENNQIYEPPVNAAKLARIYGFRVYEAAFEGEYAESVAGFIEVEKNKITVNEKDSIARRNFTIAHELGHYLLEHDLSRDYSVLMRNQYHQIPKTTIEQEANCFAAHLLVPTVFLSEFLDEGYSDEELANIFGVSKEVIRFRRPYANAYKT